MPRPNRKNVDQMLFAIEQLQKPTLTPEKLRNVSRKVTAVIESLWGKSNYFLEWMAIFGDNKPTKQKDLLAKAEQIYNHILLDV